MLNQTRLFFRLLPLLALACGNRFSTQETLDGKFRDGDTTPPGVAVTSHTSGASFGSGTFALQGNASDNVDILKIEVSVNGGSFTEAMGRTTWLYYLNTSGLSDGAYALRVRAYDTSRNRTTIDFAFNVDNSAPAAVLSTTPQLVTNSKDSAITVGGAGIVEYQFMVDNTYYSSARPVSQQISFTNYFLDGSHTISVIGKNTLGTWQATASATVYTWTVDTIPPTATMTLGTFDVNNPTTFNYTIAGAGVVNYKYSTDGGSTWSSAISTSITLSIDTAVTNLSQLKIVGIDAATNEQTSGSATTPTATAPVLLAALTMDIDDNGQIDHYKLIFNQPVNDATFPGYLGNNSLGNTTANWVVAGYSNVRIDTRDAAAPNGPGDTGTNDNIIYLAFDEKTSFDTNQAPNITTTGAGLQNPGGLTLTDLTSGSLAERDGVAPGIYKITATSGSGLLIVDFYEPVYGQNNATGSIPLAAFTWQNNSPGGATSLSALDATPQNSPGTSQIRLTLNAAPIPADGDNSTPDDALALVSGQIYDATGNTGAKTRTLRYGIKQVATGGAHTCVLNYGGSVRCWGLNNYGQLGYGHTNNLGDNAGELPTPDVPVLSAMEITTGISVSKIALGGFHTCALLSTGALRCWGRNNSGQLGYGNTAHLGDNAGEMPPANVAVLSAGEISGGATVTQVEAGYLFTCALISTGAVRCWGFGLNGQLGTGGTGNATLPGSNVPVLSAGEISGGVQITQLARSAGSFHQCVLISNGAVRCWGENGVGQLGYGSTADLGDNAGEMPPADVPTGGSIASLAVSRYHTCALRTDGNMRCWGGGATGQLGYGSTTNLGDAAGELPTANVSLGGTVAQMSISFVAYANAGYSCALLTSGFVRCWGMNPYGNLGYGNTTDLLSPGGNVPVLSATEITNGITVTQVSAGGETDVGSTGHVCALLSSDKVRCWGPNGSGQLGYNDTNWRGNLAGQLPTADVATGW